MTKMLTRVHAYLVRPRLVQGLHGADADAHQVLRCARLEEPVEEAQVAPPPAARGEPAQASGSQHALEELVEVLRCPTEREILDRDGCGWEERLDVRWGSLAEEGEQERVRD